MANLGIVFQEPLTRPNIKLVEKMSICSSTPQDHRAYTNSNQSSIGLDYFFFICGESSIVVDYRTWSNRIVLLSSIWFILINKTFDLVRVATSGVIINRCEGFSCYNDGSRSWAIKFSFFPHLIPRRFFTSHSYDALLEFDEFSV